MKRLAGALVAIVAIVGMKFYNKASAHDDVQARLIELCEGDDAGHVQLRGLGVAESKGFRKGVLVSLEAAVGTIRQGAVQSLGDLGIAQRAGGLIGVGADPGHQRPARQVDILVVAAVHHASHVGHRGQLQQRDPSALLQVPAQRDGHGGFARLIWLVNSYLTIPTFLANQYRETLKKLPGGLSR